MARAICDKCGKEFSWYGGRGRLLINQKSPCCGATASGKKGNSKRSARLDLPKIRTDVQQQSYFMADTELQLTLKEILAIHPSPWRPGGKRTIMAKPDGTFLFSRVWWGWFDVDPAPLSDDGKIYRLFKRVESQGFHGKWVNVFRIQEEEYQRLLAIREKAKNLSTFEEIHNENEIRAV